MYRRILVPLDGSPRTEAVLPQVIELARPFGSRVTLLHIAKPTYQPTDRPGRTPAAPPFPGAPAVVPERSVSSTVLQYGYNSTQLEEARAHVEAVARRLSAEGIAVEVVVEADPDVGGRIAQIAQTGDADLIALTTHARAGWERFVFGSILDRVVRATTVPLLIVRMDDA